MNKPFSHSRHSSLHTGFTLIELMVCFAIVAILSAVVIFNHKKFNDNLEITNLSYEVALAIRQAQIYGVSTRDFKEGTNTSPDDRFSTPYGIHFDVTALYDNDPASTANSYIFFADTDKDGSYTPESDIVLEQVNIGRGNYIAYVCEMKNSLWYCLPGVNPDGSLTANPKRDKLDITFQRPEPDGHFKFTSGSPPNTVKVCLYSPQNRKKEIIVYSTGQISISNSACPFEPVELDEEPPELLQ